MYARPAKNATGGAKVPAVASGPSSTRAPGAASPRRAGGPPTSTVAFAKDRVCKDCGTRYSPPTPLWASLVLVVLGGAMTVFFGIVCVPVGIALFQSHDRTRPEMSPMALVCPGTLFLFGVISLVHGIRTLVAKK